jgi:hypothetical protein
MNCKRSVEPQRSKRFAWPRKAIPKASNAFISYTADEYTGLCLHMVKSHY